LANRQRLIAADQEGEQPPVFITQQHRLTNFSVALFVNLIKEKALLDEKLKTLEFDNWTMRTTLSQMKLDGENATKELASIKVSA
jgi:hypothetical protein